MNESEFDLAARAWLEDGPTRMSDRALLSALEELNTTRQRRPKWPAWRPTPVSNFARIAIAAILGVAVGIAASNVVSRLPDGLTVGSLPTPSPTADQTPTPSASSSPADVLQFPLTTTFVSPTNGLSFKYHDRGGLEPAKELWDPVGQPPIDEAALDGSGAPHWNAFDVVETGLRAVLLAASTEIPDGVSVDEWVDAAVVKYLPVGCSAPRTQQAPITIDGQQGWIADDCPNKVVATVVTGGRLYLFMLAHSRSDARAFFDAWVGTIDLRPEEAATP